MPVSLALVEDETDLREAVQEYLCAHGIDCRGFGDAEACRAAMIDWQPAMLVTDVSLPGEDGLSLARSLRAAGPIGIIMATAAGRPIDRVRGMEAGVDDYIVKPYELRELLARIRAVARRLGGTAPRPADASPAGRVVAIGALRFDLDAMRLRDTSTGQPVTLTPAEATLLAVLAARPGRVLTRMMIAQLLGDDAAGPRAIDTRIARLRRILEIDPKAPRCIATVRDEGYRFEPGAA